MNKVVTRGFSIYKIFLKNKIAMALMMFIPGVMMLIGALNGRGNDTVAMPLGITSAGAIFTCWSFYKIGRIRADMIYMKEGPQKDDLGMVMFLQVGETLIYLTVVGVGIFLLINQGFMDKVLNLMAGGFTTLNAVIGAIDTYKRREEKNFRWWFKLVLTVVEAVFGPYFVINSDFISTEWYIAMGSLTAVAGAMEVIAALTPDSIKSTIQDGKDIVSIIKEKDDTEQLLPPGTE